MTFDEILRLFPDAKKSGDSWMARCPAHDDHSPSLQITQGDGGKTLLKCHAGCKTQAIIAKVGLTMKDLFNGEQLPRKAPRGGSAPKAGFGSADEAIASLERYRGKCAGRWDYTDPAGRLVGVVLRWNKPNGEKEILPVALVGGRWQCKAMPAPRPLYNLVDLVNRPGEVVIITEGEKAADAARGLGFLATTSAGGGKVPGMTEWAPLAGREVIILPDNDKTGKDYAAKVARRLVDLGARVKIVELPDLPDAGDIVEFIEARDAQAPGDIQAEILRLAEGVEHVQPDLLALQDEEDDAFESKAIMICMADVVRRPIDWLWKGRMALGCITLLVGKPGEGKSFVSLDIASRVSTGRIFPDGALCPMGSVILVSCEDDPAYTIGPRLDALRADSRKIHVIKGIQKRGPDGKTRELMFTLGDVPALERELKANPDCKLIVVDPIGSYMGGEADSNRDNEVRAVLAPVAALAEKYKVAVLVVAHRRKSTSGHADDLALGSRAYTGIARSVWHISRDTKNKERRFMLPGKNNLAAEGDGLAFAITGKPATVEWEVDPVTMTADEALAIENQNAGGDSKRGPKPEKRNQAEEWLMEYLGDYQEHPVKEIREAAEDEGLAWRTVQNASRDFGIKVHRKGQFGGGGVWRLPKPGTIAQDSPPEENKPYADGAIGEFAG